MLEKRLYIPQGISEIVEQLAFMMLAPPTFKDDFFVAQNVESVFYQLNEGLRLIRFELGEERYAAVTSLSNRMRRHFEADPTDTNGEAHKGRRLIEEMQVLLTGRTL